MSLDTFVFALGSLSLEFMERAGFCKLFITSQQFITTRHSHLSQNFVSKLGLFAADHSL